MLALTRRRGESIMVGDDVEIVVLSVSGEQVKLGIMAPKSITIHRKEIYEQIIAENRAAALNVNPAGLDDIRVKYGHNEPVSE